MLVGENGTGKTHILKSIYAACDITRTQKGFAAKLQSVFLPSGGHIGRLIKRTGGSTKGLIQVYRQGREKPVSIGLSFSNHTKAPEKASLPGGDLFWRAEPLNAVYIPVKDMMANAPRFPFALQLASTSILKRFMLISSIGLFSIRYVVHTMPIARSS